jgi:hypothetical protein
MNGHALFLTSFVAIGIDGSSIGFADLPSIPPLTLSGPLDTVGFRPRWLLSRGYR